MFAASSYSLKYFSPLGGKVGVGVENSEIVLPAVGEAVLTPLLVVGTD